MIKWALVGLVVAAGMVASMLADPNAHAAPSQYPLPTAVNVDYPKQLKIGEIGVIQVSYTYGEIDDDDPTLLTVPSYFPDWFEEIGLTVGHVKGVEILDKDFEIFSPPNHAKDIPCNSEPCRSGKKVAVDPTKWHTEEVRFRVNEPITASNPVFFVSISGQGLYKWMQT